MATKRKPSPYGSVKFKTIDEYHASFAPEVQIILDHIREIINLAAPNAAETISYNIPTFKQNKNLVHYAAHKEHVGFYPTPSALEVFAEKLKRFKTSKGAIQFPIDKPLPKTVIKEIVKFRVRQDKANN